MYKRFIRKKTEDRVGVEYYNENEAESSVYAHESSLLNCQEYTVSLNLLQLKVRSVSNLDHQLSPSQWQEKVGFTFGFSWQANLRNERRKLSAEVSEQCETRRLDQQAVKIP